MRVVWCVAVLLTACGGTPRDLDTVLAAHTFHDRTIDAPASRAPQPWRVGQWVLYKVTAGDELGYEQRSIVAQDACGVWIESVVQSRRARTISKVCLARAPDDAMDEPARFALMQAAMTRTGNRTIVVDFRNGQNPQTKRQMARMLDSVVSFAWKSAPSDELRTIIVTAGRFVGAARLIARVWVLQSMQTVETWIHPAVPLGGEVKIVGSDGTTYELLDYGQTGATSELPGFDEHLRDSGLD